MTTISTTNCRDETGITVGLIDSLISIARVIVRRDLTAPEVIEALRDFGSDEDIAALIELAHKEIDQ